MFIIFSLDFIYSFIEALNIRDLNKKIKIHNIPRRLSMAYPNLSKKSYTLRKIYQNLKK